MVKYLPANSGDTGDPGDPGSIPMLGKSPEVGNGNPLQYSCLETQETQVQSLGWENSLK